MFKIGLDLGYGYVKGINEAGKAVVFPSLVGNAYERPLKSLFENNQEKVIDNMHLVLMNGERYECFVGELAKRESRNVSYAFDQDKINHPNTRVLIAASCLLLFPEDKRPVHLVTGLPLEQYIHKKEEFREMLKGYKTLACFKGDEKVTVIKFDKITIFPQAAGAVYCAIMDDLHKYLVKGSYLGLVDIGFRTTDFIVFLVEDQLILREDLSGTIDAGISSLYNAADKLFTQKTGSKLDVPEIMRLISEGRIFFRGKLLDFTEELRNVKAETARIIKDRLKAVWGNKLDFFNTVFLAGGGAKDLQAFLTDIYENTILLREPQLANARGFLKVAELEEKKVKVAK
ncbi:ParM/StbA family protein [Thermosediminibacter litoriperuensis]|uniref:Plasmid segregation actin-type ATPase ParM n=1 Tax=Thermosediminibacter litoriperuensis TaxID=291989 RepID=A0A5S5AVB1_9FIRM|nr:ParM/StbA family protein [Thermosediminibacter litoriperuensis]TYP56830.1 plasmid segregation actin-type ATPase ParM [Thermosediminibacter litoriperuensis]